ncbi:MAG TPA: hypothetical protein VFT34_13470 [Verrucomicrobiae bacterium]|nr:hypothetical protein [Verrucomicrobiae bacterium]
MERGELVALRRRALAFEVGAGELALQPSPLTAKRSHEHGFNERLDVRLAGVMRAELGPLLRFNGAFKERSHDAWLNELPVCFARLGEFSQLVLGQFKHGGFLEKMSVEVADFVLPERAAARHDFEQLFHRLGEMVEIVEAGLEQFAEQLFGQQSCVLSEEAKDDAVEKAGDAEVFPLRDVHFGARPGVGQLAAFPLLQRLGDFGDCLGESFGYLRGRALWLEKVRLCK